MSDLFIDEKKLNLSLRSHLKLSQLLREQNKFEESIYTMQQATQLHPNNSEPDCFLGLLYTEINNKKLAISSYREALNKKSNQPAWVYSALVQLLVPEDETDEIIELCQQALELGIADDVLHRCLAIAFARKKNIREMLANYEKAIALNPNQPEWVYLAVGQCTALEELLFESLSNAELEDKREQLNKSIQYYKKSLKISDKQSFGVYYELAHLLLKVGKDEESLFYYFRCLEINEELFGKYSELDELLCRIYGKNLDNLNQAIQSYQDRVGRKVDFADKLKDYLRCGFLGKEGRGIDEPANYYLVNPQLKAIYCSIPKNACTLFKNMMLEKTDIKYKFIESKVSVHEYLDRNKGILFKDFIACFDSQESFKFTILRNPFKRLVSAYLDKFAKYPYPAMEFFCQKLVKTIYRKSGIELEPENSITFSQFVHYIANTKDRDLNDHWRPQSSFIGSFEFDFIGQFENLDHTIDVLQNHFNIKIAKKVAELSHVTNYQESDCNLEFHNMYPPELRQLAGMPKAEQLYTPKLLDLVKVRYANDIAMYEKAFQIKL